MVSCLSGNVSWVHFLRVFSAGMPECVGCTGAPPSYCNYLMVWMMHVLLVVLTAHVVDWVVYANFFLTLFVLSGGSFIKLTDIFLGRTIISFQIQYSFLYSGFSWMSLILSLFFICEGQSVPWKIPVASWNTPAVTFPVRESETCEPA